MRALVPNTWKRVIVGLLLVPLAGGCSGDEGQPVVEEPVTPDRVIVLGIHSGESAMGLEHSIDWAIETVNEANPGGRPLEAEYVDYIQLVEDGIIAGAQDFEPWAESVIDEPGVVAVTGVFSQYAAPVLIDARVPFITSVSTSADIFRSFAAEGHVWRTLESDAGQALLLLDEAKRRVPDGPRVALLTADSLYGQTFFDWTGFFAAEVGIELTRVVRYPEQQVDDEGNPPDIDPFVDDTLASSSGEPPDVVIIVTSFLQPTVDAVRRVRQEAPNATILLADSMYGPGLVAELGDDAEGIAGFVPVADPERGFDTAFSERTEATIPAYSANSYDAILLLAYGLAYRQAHPELSLNEGIQAAVDGRGEGVDWRPEGVRRGLELVAAGETPDIDGASGPLVYDSTLYTDPVGTYYGRWEIADGALKITETISSAEALETSTEQALLATRATDENQQELTGSTNEDAKPEMDERWALIVTTSFGWDNYRHEADALAQYQLLKSAGYDDDHIVLAIPDGLADNDSNQLPGTVVNVADGPNVRADVDIDYAGDNLTPDQILAVLSGQRSDTLPEVIASDGDDNVYVFIVGHGGHQGVHVGVAEAVYEVEEDQVLSPTMLAETLASMDSEGKYRRMFIAVEACHSGVLGTELDGHEIDDVILMTAASQFENSLGANYFSELPAWVADQFAYELSQRVASHPDEDFAALYRHLYGRVSGSHVSVFNTDRFDVKQATLGEFFAAQ